MNSYPDAAAMAAAVADAVEAIVRDALAARGHALIAVAGGSTPAAAAKLLFARPLDWKRVTLTLGDDRWVDVTDRLSNLGSLYDWREGTPAFEARLIPLVATTLKLGGDADYADAQLAPLGRFDCVWAGMGGDGHCLSWFPGPDLARALDPASKRTVVAVTPNPLPPEAPVPRLTLTYAAVAAARHRLLAATGEAKRALLEHPGAHPLAHLLALRPSIHWCPA